MITEQKNITVLRKLIRELATDIITEEYDNEDILDVIRRKFKIPKNPEIITRWICRPQQKKSYRKFMNF